MGALSLDIMLEQYWPKLSEDQKESLLRVVQNWISDPLSEKPITVEQYNLELDRAEWEMDQGFQMTHEEVVERFNKKYGEQ